MMIILVTANNFLLMFVGWEGVGVCSYLLVSFWFTRVAANQSSMSAFMTNRVGDCFLTLGMFAMLWTFGNLDYSSIFSLAPYINENAVTIISVCLLIGAMAKSSQIGLHVWLPLAMEGPTPVSALIHAATMVTAGVYLLIRSSPLIEYSPSVLILCLWIGSITTVFSSLIGLFQQDIKKVIAYSTMSQLAQEFFKFRHQTIYEEIINMIYNIYRNIISIYKKIDNSSFNSNIGFKEKNKTNIVEISKKGYGFKYKSNICKNYKLNPYYITGFIDGEGCFLINIRPLSGTKIGYHVYLAFKVKLHSRDTALLQNIRNCLHEKGNIIIRKDGYIEYLVFSIKDLEVIINHFEKYPLITQKWSDYQLFKQAFELIKCKQHLTREGLKKALSIKAALNNGLSDKLKIAFPDIVPVLRPKINKPKVLDPDWITGFVDAEGCFHVTLINNSKGAGLIFKVTQHARDAELLKKFVDYFKCGRYYTSTNTAGDYVVTKFNDINSEIIPFFYKYPLQSTKALDFYDFKQVAQLMVKKAHLTPQGLTRIKLFRSGMNKGRVNKLDLGQISDNPLNKKTYINMSYNHLNWPSNKYYSTKQTLKDNLFNEWLAGLIDGEGQLQVSKKGYANLKIIMSTKDKSALYEIKHKYGGSIKAIARSYALRYKLCHKKGLVNFVNDINGLIRNPTRMLQLNKICVLYNIKLKEPIPLTYNNGWFSGFVDADGSIYFNEQSGQLFISVTQKNKHLLDPLITLYSGRTEIIKSKEAFQYSIYRKKEILSLLDNYFSKCPLRSGKIHNLNLIKKFYTCKDYTDIQQPDKWNEWVKFKNEWDKL